MTMQPIQDLLETEMDRKEFLVYMGGAVLAILGVSGLLKAITTPSKPSSSQSNGYGSSVYGGKS